MLLSRCNEPRSAERSYKMSQNAQLNALFDSAGFLILHGLDQADGAEFGIDASPVWTVKKGGFEVSYPS